MTRRVATALLAIAIAAGALEYGPAVFSLGNHGFAGPVEARVGRPLTPVSVAGVGRRTVRRCAVGVYYC